MPVFATKKHGIFLAKTPLEIADYLNKADLNKVRHIR